MSSDEVETNDETAPDTQSICLHAFSDLSRISPPMFVALLKACYVRGTEKATKKFHVLQQQVLLVLQNSPQPGPATFVLQCLYVLPILGPMYTEGFSHLIISSLRRLLKNIPAETEAKKLAAKIFLDVTSGFVSHEGRVLIKLLEVVDVKLENIAEAMCDPEVYDGNLDKAKAYMESYIFNLVESQSFMLVVTLLERFSIRRSGDEFLMRMIEENQFEAAEKWATFMGKPFLVKLINTYLDLKFLKKAYELIKKNNLKEDFPKVHHMYKESQLKKFAEKGLWDIAESRINNNRQLLEYLVYLAMEAGYSEKVDELCERYALDGFAKSQEPQAEPTIARFLHLKELGVENIKWVDEADGGLSATSFIEECKVIGVDCELKPNYVKGNKPNKSGDEFLMRMIEENQFEAAEKWATFMGKPLLVKLINTYLDLKFLKKAYELIKKNNLKEDFPEVHHMYKESQLKKFAEKGLWDVAEARINNNRQLLEYLVYLAMEAGYSEKVDELCERYALDGFAKSQELQAEPTITRFLHLKELGVEDIKWVDEADGLLSATSFIEEGKVVGVDCEWKPNYVKGSKPNKVSIMQIASEKKVFILDLIKLSEDKPDILDSCLKRILHSSSILKLGYNLQCDLAQLSQSYGELECFKHYEMLLDIQNVFKEPRGGLSGLAKKIMGASLNKTRRNSNWEQRPLTQQQIEYAALDAVVLIHIFYHIRNQPQATSANSGQPKMEWKSNIVSHMVDTKKSKPKKTPKPKSRKKGPPMTNTPSN